MKVKLVTIQSLYRFPHISFSAPYGIGNALVLPVLLEPVVAQCRAARDALIWKAIVSATWQASGKLVSATE